jgi:hypothetical protein
MPTKNIFSNILRKLSESLTNKKSTQSSPTTQDQDKITKNFDSLPSESLTNKKSTQSSPTHQDQDKITKNFDSLPKK